MATDLTIPSGYVLLSEEMNPMRGHLVAGALGAADIPAHVEEDDLADEFAMSLKLRGAPRVRVLVPGDRIEEARAVFLAMSQPIPVVEDDEFSEYEATRRRRTRRIVLVLFAVGTLPLIFFMLADWFGWFW